MPATPPQPETAAPPAIERTAGGEALGASLDPALTSERFLERVPMDFARDRLVLSQGVGEGGRERVAVAGRPGDPIVLHNLAARLERAIEPVRADPEALAGAIDRLAASLGEREGSDDASEAVDDDGFGSVDEADVAALLAADERDLLQTAGRAPVVRLVNGLLFEALRRGASDVHVQPLPEATLVRFRVDGTLTDARRLPRKLLAPVVSRIKVMAAMDIAERRLPQDGRAVVTIGRDEVDLRVSSLPTALGERVVVRLLDKRRAELFDLGRLGMPKGVRDRFAALCERPYGMVLVTGPTGSGKTTTLYSVLRGLNVPGRNILTLEDPIEYELEGISQSQVNARKGVTFATGLRHILRQDPDVIMVGEVRDGETARIAIQSALTGHLVLSTLHTNSAASAVTRLVDLGVEPYLLTASVSAVLAQRLVRTFCEDCDGSGQAGGDAPCERCLGSGFAGRRGLFELLVTDGPIQDLIRSGATAAEIERAGAAAGMRTLRDEGLDLVERGLTSRAEVDRVTLVAEDA